MVEEKRDSSMHEEMMQEGCEEMDDKEIYDVEGLEREKSGLNEFRVEHNAVHNQTNIQRVGTVNYFINKMISIKPTPVKGESYNLRKQEEYIAFVEKYRETDYFLVAFILCVFEAVHIADLQDLKMKLTSCLLEGIYHPRKYEDEIEKKMMDPYTSINSIISVIQGQYYKDNEERYVSLGKEYLDSLTILLEQFPDMRNILINFIASVLQENSYHTLFYKCQIVAFFKYLYTKKVIDVEKELLPLLCLNQINIDLLGVLFYELYEDKDTYDNANRIIGNWLQDRNGWLWKPATIVYVYLKEKISVCSFEKKLEKVIIDKIRFGSREDFFFLSELLMCSNSFCLLVCHAISKLYVRENYNKTILYAYMKLVRYCYYRVDNNNIRLPLVTCNTKEQIQALEEIISSIMVDYRLRKQMYSILQAYIRELSRYDYTPRLINHIAAFCHALSGGNSIYEIDIIEVIKRCPKKIANEIINTI